MKKAPIEILMDSIGWKPLPPFEGESYGLPHATHYGVLYIAGHKLRCYQLSDGQRIFDGEDVQRFFGMKK